MRGDEVPVDMRHAFPPDERAAFYHVIETRRDIRAFRSDPIPEDILMKILGAAHHAPSVGLMQPWNFIVIHDRATKARVHALFLQENQAAAANYEGPRAALYRTLKLEGIEDAPVNVCVTCDRTRGRASRARTKHHRRHRPLQHLLRDREPVARRSRGGHRRRLGQHPRQ